MKQSRIFHYSEVHLYLFAKKGFTRGCREAAAAMKNVTLVSYQDLLEKITD